MGEFNKETLSNYADFHCERRLFWDLGIKDNKWILPFRNKVNLKHYRSGTQLMTLGKNYEDRIYEILEKQPHMNLVNIKKTKIKKEDFIKWKEFLSNKNKQALLIEPEFIIPENYLLNYFTVTDIKHINIKDVGSSCRPDIIVLKRNDNYDKTIRALKSDGTSYQLSHQEKQSKIGIYIFDVKLTHPDLIKPRHLIQILFYMHTITHLIEHYNLEEYFYVSVSNNGIIGNYTDFLPITLDELTDKYVTQVNWDNSSHFYRETQKVILKLMKKIPCSVNSSRTNIQAACGRCTYLDDCKTTLGFYDNDPAQMSLELLPYISQSLAYQMKNKNWKTVEDVNTNIHTIANSTIPNALYPQIPHLKIISEALLKQTKIKPKADSIKSIKIPAYSELSLVFSVEEDSAYKRLFAFSVDFEVRMYNTQYKELFEKWWHFWNDILSLSKEELDNKKDNILKRFKAEINEDISMNKLITIKNLFDRIIKQQEGRISFKKKNPSFQCNLSYLSDDIDEKAELALAKALINNAFDIIMLCSYIDEYIQVTIKIDEEKEIDVAPSFAIFYWSQEILQAVEDMLGRQLVNLMDEM